MNFELLRKFQPLATLAVLAVLLLVGVTWGWSAVTEPFPESEDAPICEDTVLAAGEKVFPDQVTVSVLNSGSLGGLAERTMEALETRGFVAGDLGNAPSRPKVVGAEIWTNETDSAAARLVATYLSKNGKGILIREMEPEAIGINVIVGDNFAAVVKGRQAVTAKSDATICSPPQVDE